MSVEYKTTAVLFSGGLDSAVLVAEAAQAGAVVAIYVSTGLAWEAEERAMIARLFAAQPFAGRVASPVSLTFDMTDVLTAEHWSVRGTPPGFDTPDEDVYIPGRNVILLAKAAVYLAASGLATADRRSRIMMGQLAGNPFPDATPQFLDATSRALSLGLAAPIDVQAPFATRHKEDVIRLGADLGVPLELTLSCMRPNGGWHCGQCSKCRERRDAFRAAGIEDRTIYATRPPR